MRESKTGNAKASVNGRGPGMDARRHALSRMPAAHGGKALFRANCPVPAAGKGRHSVYIIFLPLLDAEARTEGHRHPGAKKNGNSERITVLFFSCAAAAVFRQNRHRRQEEKEFFSIQMRIRETVGSTVSRMLKKLNLCSPQRTLVLDDRCRAIRCPCRFVR